MSSAPDDFDGLASAFLSKPASRRGDGSHLAMPSILIVGNVPTLAGIWIAQYADQLARANGPVALVRLDGAASRGEMFRAQGRAMPTDPAQWLERASAVTRNWILCVDALRDVASVASSGCPIVLLSGADEAAVAAAQRQIESIDAAAVGAGIKALRVDLALVGSPEDQARDAARSLVSRARQSTLVTQVSLAMHAQRVDRVESTGPVPLGMFASLDVAGAAEHIAQAIDGSSMRIGSPRSIAPLALGASLPTPSAAAPAPAQRSVAPHPAAAPSAGACAPVADYFPEFVVIPFICPQCKDVALAHDARGDLHLILHGGDPSGLRVAVSWARANWQLLCAAVPALNSASTHHVEHLLLDDARTAVALHQTGVLLHAKVEIQAGGATIRQRIDLNDDSTSQVG